MSSSSPLKTSTKEAVTAASGSEYRPGISASASQAPTLVSAYNAGRSASALIQPVAPGNFSTLNAGNLPTTPGYFSEKHEPKERQPQDHTVEIYEEPPEGSSHDPLILFHQSLGIPRPNPPKPPKATKKNPHPDPPGPPPRLTKKNKGIYDQVLRMEKMAQWKYHFCNSTVTFAMFLQIIVGAAVTAFGAGDASHILITVFGAANTALASLLAVLKSQGLPNRIRQDWNGWRELREYIEKKEREIEMVYAGRTGDGSQVELKDVWELVKEIELRYNTVRLTTEANRPDTYIRVPPVLSK